MRRNFSDFRGWLDTAPKLWSLGKEIIGAAFPRKTPALRIPPCSGYFIREEDSKIREKLKILCKSRNLSSVKTLILHGPLGHGRQYSAANLMNQLYTSPISNSFLLRSGQGRTRFSLEKATIKWTLNATNTRTLFESYCSLAKEIGLSEEAKAANWELSLHSRTSEGRQYNMFLHDYCQKDAYDGALAQIYEEVMKTLRQHDSWVLLINGPNGNVTGLKRFWPQPGDRRFGNGLVIMTTEHPKLMLENGDDSSLEKVFIGKMTNHDAVNFLQSKSGIEVTSSDRMCAEDIAVNMLKCIPQDIASFGADLKEYQQETKKKLSFRDLAGTNTATPLEFMLLLEMTHKNQEKLLKFLACCSREDYLPLKILESYFSEATEAVEYSKFVKISEKDEVKVVEMHRRHRDTLRDILSRQEPTLCEKTSTGFFRQLFSHLGSVRNKTDRISLPTLSSHDISEVIKCLGSICKDALHWSRDEDFITLRFILPHLKEAVELSKHLKAEGEIEPLVMANGHACLGESLLFFGESEEARKNLEMAFCGYRDYSGPENVQLDVANVLHFLGEAYGNSYLGDPSRGEKYLQEALKEKEQYYKGCLGAHHQVAFTLRSLGNVLNELGRHNEAIYHIERALKIYRDSQKDSNLKQEYGDTLSTMGSSYRYLGQYVRAEDYLKKALKIFRSVDSPSKLRMGVTLSRLGSVQRNLEKLDESIKSLKEAQKMLENNDIYSAVILSKLSVVYRHNGDPTNSLYFAEKASEITDKHHGTKDHPVIATALLNLGHAQMDMGNVEDAERNLTKALDINKALHGENHRITIANLNYLGYTYLQMGRVRKGKEMLERAVEIMDKYSPPHPEKANSQKRLSKACLILGETVKSADLANSALQIYKGMYGNTMQHREVRKCKVRIAYACSKIGLFNKAKEFLKEVELGFPQDKMTLPEFASFLQKKTEITLDNLEFSWPLDKESIRKIHSKAETDLNKAEEIIQQFFGCNHQRYASVKKEKARLYVLMGHHQFAYNEIMSALKIITNIWYQKPDLQAEVFLIRADAEGKLQLTTGQKESLETAGNIYRNASGNNHLMFATSLQKLCSKYLELGCLNEAEKYFNESDKICEILKRDLQEQLNTSNSDFLMNYKLDTHPILKRQQTLARKIRPNPGAW